MPTFPFRVWGLGFRVPMHTSYRTTTESLNEGLSKVWSLAGHSNITSRIMLGTPRRSAFFDDLFITS